MGVEGIIPRAEVGKSTGCRRLSRLYRCLIGMGGRYEAGWRGWRRSSSLRLSPFLEARVLSIFFFFSFFSSFFFPPSPPCSSEVLLGSASGTPGDRRRPTTTLIESLENWASSSRHRPRLAIVLLVSIGGLIKFMDDKTVDGVGPCRKIAAFRAEVLIFSSIYSFHVTRDVAPFPRSFAPKTPHDSVNFSQLNLKWFHVQIETFNILIFHVSLRVEIER